MNNGIIKYNYLYYRQDGLCAICGTLMSLNEKLDMHHKCRRHKWRLKKFPLFIDSIINLELCHHDCHLSKDGGHISDYQAERYEIFLRNHPKKCSFVNNPVGNYL